MNTALTLNAQRSLEFNDLAAMSRQFQHYPILSLAQEQSLFARLRQDNDRQAAEQLILAHMRYVISVAKGYLSYGLPGKDLVQEGTVGLMKAVKNFQPSKGVRLVSYAVHWIKAEMHEYILQNWRLVKMATTKAQRKLFFNLRKLKNKTGWLSTEETANIAQELNVPTREVAVMEQRFSAIDESLQFEQESEDNFRSSAQQSLSYDADNPADIISQAQWQSQQQALLAPALADLEEREQIILQSRWLSEKKTPLKELSARFNVSMERIRQIETIAINKLREALIA